MIPMKSVPTNRYYLFFLIAIAGCWLDLVTKHWIFRRLGMPGTHGDPWWLWQEVVGFQTSLNEGALFGIGQGKVFLFAVLSVVAVIGILVWLFGFGAAEDRTLTFSMGMVTAGIFGNLYDRLGLHGLQWHYTDATHQTGEPVYAVRDWILVMIGDWPWPNFNIADSLLVSGAVLLAIYALTYREPEPYDETPEREAGDSGQEA